MDADFDARTFAEAIEARLLGGPRTLSPRGLSERAGLDQDSARRLWRSMGFAITDDDEVALTDQDLAASQRVKRAIDLGIVSFDEVVSIARLTGQVFAQLADNAGAALARIALSHSETDFDGVVDLLADEILPLLEDQHRYVWRRQLAAYVARNAARYDRDGLDDAAVTVGFADISGYTSLSRHTSESGLAGLLELFESVATDAVGAHGGRVVKLIGDAVLFTTAEPTSGADVAVDLLDAWPADQPSVRAGVATGPVLRRLGDVFGPTVNVASRLTSVAEPGEIRIDEATYGVLAADRRFRVVEQAPRDVRGYEQLKSWTVRRTAD